MGTTGSATKGSTMSGPFIFIATNRLREGKLAAERERARDLSSFIEANEPQLLAFNEYANEEGTEVGVVQMPPIVLAAARAVRGVRLDLRFMESEVMRV